MLRTAPAAIVCFLAAAAVPAHAVADACSGVTATAEEVQISVEPPTPCIGVTVEAPGCGDGLALVLDNGCAAPIVVVAADFVCDKGPEVSCSPVAPGETARRFPSANEEGLVDEEHVVELEGASITIHVGYREVISEAETSHVGSCAAAAGAGTSRVPRRLAGAAAGAIAMLAAMALLRRRRR